MNAFLHKNVACLLLGGAVFSAGAADGTINFTGEILEQACTINVGTNNTLTVDLGKVAKTAFSAAGVESGTTKFTIKLKDCPDTITSAKVRFDGVPDTTDSTLLAITSGTGTATGVAIKLMNADKTTLPLHSVTNYGYALDKTKENLLDFYAAYQSTAAIVTAGKANSVTNFTVSYN
ncbi:fimbrial protein [Enterobacter sp. ENT03]|uniref:fimbrial protein n=1 Tax=Enterobacter sp. ENT03 TaxID=2854780 RepID=UPI001C469FAE|nr:fimbrial protein [Enterobacter sp. ENT03]MBV7406122.1 type 1 fimbrial protein [Enterobacter sp. ENT03]